MQIKAISELTEYPINGIPLTSNSSIKNLTEYIDSEALIEISKYNDNKYDSMKMNLIDLLSAINTNMAIIINNYSASCENLYRRLNETSSYLTSNIKAISTTVSSNLYNQLCYCSSNLCIEISNINYYPTLKKICADLSTDTSALADIVELNEKNYNGRFVWLNKNNLKVSGTTTFEETTTFTKTIDGTIKNALTAQQAYWK